MDVDGLIGKIEKHLREFILYILSFFDPKSKYNSSDQVNETVVFGVISAFLGTYLWSRYLFAGSIEIEDAGWTVVDKLLEWLTIGVITYAALRVMRIKVELIGPIVAVIRTLSIAHILAIVGAYLFVSTLPLFADLSFNLFDLTNNELANFSYVIYIGLVVFYLPREIGRLPLESASRWRLVAANAMSIVFFLLLFVLSHFALPNACAIDPRLPDKENASNKITENKNIEKKDQDDGAIKELNEATQMFNSNYCGRYRALNLPEGGKNDHDKSSKTK